MLKRVFFINHAPKEFHNLLTVLVILGLLFSTVFLFNGIKKSILLLQLQVKIG